MRAFFKLINKVLLFLLSGSLAALFAVIAILFIYGQQLPNHKKLRTYELPMSTRLVAEDGSPIARYAVQHRLFQPLEELSPHLLDAFVSAEDRFFWQHHGLDGRGLARATWRNLLGIFENTRPQGGSTITQQVSKNFLLTNEVTLRRKIKEIVLSFRLERSLSKKRILELYLNGIYLGRGNWGVTAASLYYFGRMPDRLTIAEAAYLAALPKAPNSYHPVKNRKRALARRNWIIRRMLEDGRITADRAYRALKEPLQAPAAETAEEVAKTSDSFAAYFAEEARRRLLDIFGRENLYEGGMVAHTTLDPELQRLAESSLQEALLAYDRARGWRSEPLSEEPPIVGWQTAAITALGVESPDGRDQKPQATAILADGQPIRIRNEHWAWAEKAAALAWDEEDNPIAYAEPIKVGAKVYVEPMTDGFYALRQTPEVSGAIVAMDSESGRVRALYGGFSQRLSEYNRATQALRQPGSAFKPIVFLTALEKGWRPTDTIPDAPFVYDQGEKFGLWRPRNFGDRFNGSVTLEKALSRSLNLATLRLAHRLGIEEVRDTAVRLGLYPALPPHLSIALGSQETTLLKLTTIYASFANGGREVKPRLIDFVQDRYGNLIYPTTAEKRDQFFRPPPRRLINEKRVAALNRMLRKAVSEGTARQAITAKGADIAGKTGTSNDAVDAWFIGFTPKLAVGVFVGYDKPQSLGKNVGGGTIAAPIFDDFIKGVLKSERGRRFYGGRFAQTDTTEIYSQSRNLSLDEPLGLY